MKKVIKKKTKACAECGETLALGEFNIDTLNKDGLSVYCFGCTHDRIERASELFAAELGVDVSEVDIVCWHRRRLAEELHTTLGEFNIVARELRSRGVGLTSTETCAASLGMTPKEVEVLKGRFCLE